jgi:RNA polymerase sigma-70 factor (ECF subfamily)
MGADEHGDRRYLMAVAYRLLGSAVEAEDAVQEAYLRLHAAAPADLANPRAWLTTVVSRVCLDQLRSARVRRERYVGTWLPEPLLAAHDAGGQADHADAVALRESARVAVLLVLERLSPAERVAFVLHDAFGMSFDRIAEAVGRTADACRQLASRARRRVREDAPPRRPASTADRERTVAAFFKASTDGDLAELVSLLDPEVVLRSDGGGAVPAARKVVVGAEPVLALLAGLGRVYAGARAEPIELASGPGFLLTREGAPIGVLAVELSDGRVVELNLMVNPAKFARLAA